MTGQTIPSELLYRWIHKFSLFANFSSIPFQSLETPSQIGLYSAGQCREECKTFKNSICTGLTTTAVLFGNLASSLSFRHPNLIFIAFFHFFYLKEVHLSLMLRASLSMCRSCPAFNLGCKASSLRFSLAQSTSLTSQPYPVGRVCNTPIGRRFNNNDCLIHSSSSSSTILSLNTFFSTPCCIPAFETLSQCDKCNSRSWNTFTLQKVSCKQEIRFQQVSTFSRSFHTNVFHIFCTYSIFFPRILHFVVLPIHFIYQHLHEYYEPLSPLFCPVSPKLSCSSGDKML